MINSELEQARKYITDRIPREELLAQLAEEAAELVHAALKLRRVYDGTNPTPVEPAMALANIKEEIADVALLVQLLELDHPLVEIEGIKNAKLLRWRRRLKQKEGTKQ